MLSYTFCKIRSTGNLPRVTSCAKKSLLTLLQHFSEQLLYRLCVHGGCVSPSMCSSSSSVHRPNRDLRKAVSRSVGWSVVPHKGNDEDLLTCKCGARVPQLLCLHPSILQLLQLALCVYRPLNAPRPVIRTLFLFCRVP